MVRKKRHFQTAFQFLIAEEKRMYSRVSRFTRLALILACTSLLPLAMAAQDNAAKPAAQPSAQAPSKWDLFAGYSYLAPKGSIINNGTQQDNARSVSCCVDVSLARYFTNFFRHSG